MNSRILPLAAIALLTALSSEAARISPEQALQRASSSSPKIANSISRSGDNRYVLVDRPATSKRDRLENIYVFNDNAGRGYLIIPADDEVEPILAYADKGKFSYENMPDGMAYMLSIYDREISSISDVDSSANPRSFTGRGGNNAIDVAPLLKSSWGQGEPYNLQCPNEIGWDISGSWSIPCPTGCVATAMAQIMYYHKWPANGTDKFAEESFDWDNMIDSYTPGSYTDEQANAVAHLMHKCGESVNMRYQASASGASIPLVVSALGNYFLYEKSTMKTIYRDYMPLKDVHEALYAELGARRPVLVGADSREGGHAFVLDGCTTDGFFHINWGWDGMCDGFFKLSALNPDQQGTGGGLGAYNYNQVFYIGIQKQLPDPKDYTYSGSDLIASGDIVFDDFNFNTWRTVNNSKFCGFKGFLNNSPHFTEFIIGIKAVSTTTGKEYISWEDDSYYHTKLESSEYKSSIRAPYRLADDAPNDTYKIYPVYKTPEDDTPRPIRVPLGMRDHAIMKREGSIRFTVTNPEKESKLLLSDIGIPARIPMGSEQPISFNLKNEDSDYYHGDITISIKNLTSGTTSTLEYVMTEAGPDESLQLSLDAVFEYDMGEYQLVFTDIRDKELATSQTFTIAEPDRSDMTALDETNFPDPEFRRCLEWYDKNRDGYLSISEKKEITDIYIEEGYDIHSLQGIELLPEVSYLCCRNNNLSYLDVSKLNKLWELSVYGNKIETIIFGDHPLLENVSVEDNLITSLALCNMPKLENAYFQNNKIETLEVRDCNALKMLYGRENRFKSINLTNLPLLESLTLTVGDIESIDLSAMRSLKVVRLDELNLRSIDTSNQPMLEELTLSYNKLPSIDLSNNQSLIYFSIYNNEVGVYTDNGKFDMTELEKYGFDYTRCNRYQTLGMEGKTVNFGAPSDPNPLERIEYWYQHNGPAEFGIQCPFYLVNLGPNPNSGIDDILTDDNITVNSSNGYIVINGTSETATVHDITGREIYKGLDRRIPVATGIYLVTVGGNTHKILIK